MPSKLVIEATLPCRRITFRSTSKPETSISITTARDVIPVRTTETLGESTNNLLNVSGAIAPKNVGPNNIPAIISPIIIGCLISLSNSPRPLATKSIREITIKNITISEDVKFIN